MEGAGGWGVPYNNARLAFGSLVAENLDADYHVTAVSGIGLVRNYSDHVRRAPDARGVRLAVPAEHETRRSSTRTAFAPDAILIVLGTNDFSPGDNPPEDPRAPMDVDEYAEAYIAFVDQLLADDHYPDAHIFALGSPMLTDGWPSATDTFRDDLESCSHARRGALRRRGQHPGAQALRPEGSRPRLRDPPGRRRARRNGDPGRALRARDDGLVGARDEFGGREGGRSPQDQNYHS